MTENDGPTRDGAVEAGSQLPVPVRPAPSPVPPAAHSPTRVDAALQRIRPALPILVRGVAAAATLGAAGFIAAKSGPRLLRRAPQLLPLPLGPALPVSSGTATDLLPQTLPSGPDVVIVTREFVRWTRTEVYRHPAPRRP